MHTMTLEDLVLRELHRAAGNAGRPGISLPSVDLEEVIEQTGDRKATVDTLTRLIRTGRVARVRMNVLVLPDAAGLLNVDLVDVVDVIAPRPYLITGGRALERFNLTDQHYFGVVVLVPTENRPLRYRGQTATFLKTDPENIWGWEKDDDKPRYALPERALIDVINRPKYGVSLARAIDALKTAVSRDPEFLDRLHASVRRYGAGTREHGSRAAARRIGFVVDRLFGREASEPFLKLIGTSRRPTLLRPGGPPSEEVDATWMVVVNVATGDEVES